MLDEVAVLVFIVGNRFDVFGNHTMLTFAVGSAGERADVIQGVKLLHFLVPRVLRDSRHNAPSLSRHSGWLVRWGKFHRRIRR